MGVSFGRVYWNIPELAALGTVKSPGKKICWPKKLIHPLIRFCSGAGTGATEKKTA